jgi:long-chain acyl-CoA synthetase
MPGIPEKIWSMIQEKQQLPAVWTKEDGQYNPISYTQFGDMLVRLTRFLSEKGIMPGDKIALMSANRYEWPVIDLAIQSCAAVNVPLYPNINTESVRKALVHSEAKIFILANSELYEKHRSALEGLPVQLITIENVSSEISHLGWLRLSKATMDERLAYLEKITALDENALISINYTSGTTGEPKGVMLSHRNILADMEGALATLTIYPTDRFLSFLPLSHGFERTAGYYIPLSVGAEIAYAEGMLTVIENAKEIHPTIITTVPRLLEKVYENVNAAIAQGSAIKKSLFRQAAKTGAKASTSEKLSAWENFQHKLFEKLIYSKIRGQISPRLRLFISGGAPLSAAINNFFRSLNIGIVEGYGLTETSPVLTLNPLEWSKAGSAGRPLNNVELKIAEDNEIIVRGEMVMKGYFKAPDLTEEVLSADGWFHTGDVGYLDGDNFLFITDRKKDLIVTAGGKNIAPQPIEQALTLSPFIEQAVIIGDRRKFITALIVPAYETLKKELQLNLTAEELIKNSDVIAKIEAELSLQTEKFSRFEQVKKFALLAKPFTIDSGELTPTLKTRRRIIENHYNELVETLYQS